MAIRRAFVETTVLTDALLKPHSEEGRTARETLKRYDITELPQYAIKEFKAGPLSYMVWFHNKLVTVRSFQFALDALHGLSLSPQRYRLATALEALREAQRHIGKSTNDGLRRMYGPAAQIDAVLSDRYRLAIKTSVLKAWKQRRAVVSSVVMSTDCYSEVGPYEDAKNLLIVPERRCHPESECSHARELKTSPETLQLLRAPSIDSKRNLKISAAPGTSPAHPKTAKAHVRKNVPLTWRCDVRVFRPCEFGYLNNQRA